MGFLVSLCNLIANNIYGVGIEIKLPHSQVSRMLTAETMIIYGTYVFVGLSVSALIAVVGIYVSRITYKRKIRRWKTHSNQQLIYSND